MWEISFKIIIRFGFIKFMYVTGKYGEYHEVKHTKDIHGEGVNFHYKGIYRRAAGMGYTFQASKYI